MQAVVVLPDLARPSDRAALLRRVAAVPLLIRVLATAARGGATSVLVVHQRDADVDWVRTALRSPLLSGLSVALVPAAYPFEPSDPRAWRDLAGVLETRFLWLPWNVVMLRSTLAVLIAAGERLNGEGTGGSSRVMAEKPGAATRPDPFHAPGVVTTSAILGEPGAGLREDVWTCWSTPASHGSGVIVDSDRTAREAEAMLVHGSGKPSDGIYSTFNRRLCRPAVRWLVRSTISANAVSLAGLPVVALAGYLYALGGWQASVAAALVYFVSVLLDEVDGMLARATFSESAFGAWLDTVSDYASYLVLWIGMSLGLWREHGSDLWLTLGGLTLVVSVLVFVVLIGQRRRVSTPGAFNAQLMQRLEADSDNVLSRAIRLLSFLPKKAVFSHYVVWFSVLGLQRAFVSLAAFGSIVTLAFVLYSNRFFREPDPAVS